MNSVIGAILPSALGIALSPLAIVAVIVALRSPNGKRAAGGFVLGWAVGIAVAVIVLNLLASIIPHTAPQSAGLITGIIAIVVGAVLLLLAFNEVRAGADPNHHELPGWSQSLAEASFVAAAMRGVLAVAAPKNLVLALAGGLIVGVSGLPIWQLVITIAVFVVVAVSLTLIVFAASLVSPTKTAGVLESAREWLAAHSSAVVASVAFIVGVTLIGQGVGTF